MSYGILRSARGTFNGKYGACKSVSSYARGRFGGYSVRTNILPLSPAQPCRRLSDYTSAKYKVVEKNKLVGSFVSIRKSSSANRYRWPRLRAIKGSDEAPPKRARADHHKLRKAIVAALGSVHPGHTNSTSNTQASSDQA